MVNINILVGRVCGIVHTERNDLLLVKEISEPKYPQTVACEFYGEKNRKLLEGVADGDLVRVGGSTKSREYQGKWFTTFSAFKLTRLVEQPAPGEPYTGPGHENDVTPF
jgi:hypothetical protein